MSALTVVPSAVAVLSFVVIGLFGVGSLIGLAGLILDALKALGGTRAVTAQADRGGLAARRVQPAKAERAEIAAELDGAYAGG